jgi:hypothetical protein
METGAGKSRWRFAIVIGVLVLMSRLAFISKPYFVDGPAHVRAVTSGANFIQPPGYFLFNKTAWLLVHALSISSAAALMSLNIAFSIAGAIIFALLVTRSFPGPLGMLLAVFYAFSDVAWFVAEVHSSYASVTFFAPLLLYVVWFMESGWIVGVVWGVMAGFRPSDGVFVLPFIAWMLIRKPKQIPFFLATAVPIFTLWYFPTVQHFGGGILSPLHAAAGQVERQANGIFASDSPLRKIGNLVHVGTAAFDGWNLLAVAMLLGMFACEKRSKDLVVYMLPGLLFYILYFFSDPSYFSFLLAPGVILAGYGLSRFRPATAYAITAIAITISIVQMALLRPIGYKNEAEATLDAYVLEYSGWGLRHEYFLLLHEAVADMHQRRQ